MIEEDRLGNEKEMKKKQRIREFDITRKHNNFLGMAISSTCPNVYSIVVQLANSNRL